MSYKIKSSLYLAGLAIALIVYYAVGQDDVQEFTVKNEITKTKNLAVAIPNALVLNDLK